MRPSWAATVRHWALCSAFCKLGPTLVTSDVTWPMYHWASSQFLRVETVQTMAGWLEHRWDRRGTNCIGGKHGSQWHQHIGACQYQGPRLPDADTGVRCSDGVSSAYLAARPAQTRPWCSVVTRAVRGQHYTSEESVTPEQCREHWGQWLQRWQEVTRGVRQCWC